MLFSERADMPASPRVLIIDDDPSHLEIYGMIVQRAGFEPIPVLVRFSGSDPIPDSKIDLVLLDYRLELGQNCARNRPGGSSEVLRGADHPTV